MPKLKKHDGLIAITERYGDDNRPETVRFTRAELDVQISTCADEGGYASPTWMELFCLLAQTYETVRRLRGDNVSRLVLEFPKR
jgi:hypothetical protein